MGLCYSRFLNIEHEEEAEYELDHEKLSLRRASTIKLELRKYVSYTQDKVSDIYEIKEVIGEGAYGCVRRVIHKMTGMERAMKSILKSYAGAEGLNVIQEADILKELDHPNIVKIYDIIEDARLYHLIMELNTGSELFDKVVKNHALSEKEVAQYMYYIFSGVSYCHQNHVIHRDLKPENVMFQDNSPDSPLKIIDFGISIMQPFSKKKPNFYGRPYYAAPEVAIGMITDKCDVWSCGVIMYLLLCGYLPFGGKSDKMIMNSIQNDDLLFPEKEWGKISQEAKDLLSRVLSKDPELRMTSKQAFHHSWIQNYNQNSDLELQLSNDSLTKLAQFKSNITIKHAALEYISSHYCAQKDLKKLQKAFKAMDRNGDGKLSREELAQIYNNANLTRRIDIQQMINEIDADFNGFVDYSEFITATIDWEKELSKKKLEATFRTFDLDRSGGIDVQELKQVLGGDQIIDDETWNRILAEADFNCNGKIELSEFEHVLTATFI